MKPARQIPVIFFCAIITIALLAEDFVSGQQPPNAGPPGPPTARLVRKASGVLLDAKGMASGKFVFAQGMTFPVHQETLLGIVVENQGRLLRFEKRDVEFIRAQPHQAPVAGGAFVPGVIQITKATFGPVDGRRANVKNALIRLLPPGGMLDRPFQMEVNGAMFGKRDPVTMGIVNEDGTAITIQAPRKQSLEVTYVFGNKVETVVLLEGSALILPRP